MRITITNWTGYQLAYYGLMEWRGAIARKQTRRRPHALRSSNDVSVIHPFVTLLSSFRNSRKDYCTCGSTAAAGGEDSHNTVAPEEGGDRSETNSPPTPCPSLFE